MCGSRIDVVLCSFAFERVHRRLPLCRGHRQPLIEMDHFTRQPADESANVPAAWLAAGPAAAPARLPRRRRPAAAESGGATLIMLADRRANSATLVTSSAAPGG